MDDDRAYFEKWFKQPLLNLQKDSDAGFVIVMISLALLERYLREKSGDHENPQLSLKFRVELSKIFPALTTDDLAREFWEVCRHGLMHQTTFKLKSKLGDVNVGVYESANEIEVTCTSAGNVFMISPTRFSSKVIQVIESDFPTFEGRNSPNHPLPGLHSIAAQPGYSGVKR